MHQGSSALRGTLALGRGDGRAGVGRSTGGKAEGRAKEAGETGTQEGAKNVGFMVSWFRVLGFRGGWRWALLAADDLGRHGVRGAQAALQVAPGARGPRSGSTGASASDAQRGNGIRGKGVLERNQGS